MRIRPRFALILAIAPLFAGCGGEALIEAQVPSEFPAPVERWRGCPEVSGLYAWPPAQGRARVSLIEPPAPGPRLDDLEPLVAPLHTESQVWVDASEQTPGLVVRTRMVNRDPNYLNRRLTTEWSYHELGRSDLGCDGTWLEFATDVTDPAVVAHYGTPSLAAGVRFARLPDGGLLIGQWLRIDQRIEWHWSRLARVADTGRDAPPVDASLP
jgi:hypothetical protein